MKSKSPFSADESHNYWVQRHRDSSREWDSVGFKGGSRELNEAFYSCRRNALLCELKFLGYDLRDCRVLDVGCGLGAFSKLYHELGAEVVGIDISPDAVDYCNSLNIGSFVQSSIAELKSRVTGQFKIIHCFDVLYHVTSDDEWLSALDAFSSLSTPDAVWFISEIHTNVTGSTTAHVVKRATQRYHEALKIHGRKIAKEMPLYWLYSAAPRLANYAPRLVEMLEFLGPITGRFLVEYAVLWTVRKNR